jgi:hypothetical protein
MRRAAFDPASDWKHTYETYKEQSEWFITLYAQANELGRPKEVLEMLAEASRIWAEKAMKLKE